MATWSSSSSVASKASNDGSRAVSCRAGGGASEEGTFEASSSLTSSIEMRGECADGVATLGEGDSGLGSAGCGTSISSSIQMRSEEVSTCSGSFANELSLPSSFASDPSSSGATQTYGDSADSREVVESFESGCQSEGQRYQQKDNTSGTMQVYDGQVGERSQISPSGDGRDDNTNGGSLDSEDRLALRISKETKPMMHLLRLLKDMEGNNSSQTVGKGRAVASLISDFEREVTLIEHKIKDENLIMNGEQPPLPPNWIALEDPDSGDIYYANETTGKTQWERPGPMSEWEEKTDDINNSNHNNFESSQLNNSNNIEGSQRDNDSGGSHRSNDYDGSERSNNFEGSHRSNNFDTSQRSSNFEGSNMYESSQKISNNSNSDFEGSHSNVHLYEINTSDKSKTDSNDLEGSHTNMTSTYDSSLTDSNDCQGLPPNWITLEDPDTGETYFANEVTGESTWDRPMMPQSSVEEKDGDDHESGSTGDGELPPDWIALQDADSGDTYYLNQVTMATTWDRPTKENDDNVKADLAEVDDSSQQSQEEDNVPPGWEKIIDPSSGDYYYVHDDGETQWERPSFSQLDIAPEDDGDGSQQPPPGKDDGGIDSEDENKLPPGWFSAVDEDSGDKYYCNELSGETTWDFPTEPAVEDASTISASESPVDGGSSNDDLDANVDEILPPGWFAVTDPSSGDPYYVHEESGETTWNRPQRGNFGPGMGGGAKQDQHLLSRTSLNETTVYEDDSVTSSQY